MAKYTTEIRTICEQYCSLTESKGYSDIADIIEEARPHIFDFNYPIYDPTHKSELETKIILHYYRREIGYETVGEFKRALWSRMVDIMPYYNEMYRIDALEYDPFINVDYEVTGNDSRGTITHDTGGTIGQVKNTGTQTNNKTNTGTQTNDTDYTGTQTNNTDYTGTQNIDTDYTGTQNTDTDYTGTQGTVTTYTGTESEGTVHGHTDTETKNLTTTTEHSDTPQGGLTGVSAGTYLSDATIVKETGTDTHAHSGTDTVTKSFTNRSDGVQRTDNLNTDSTRTDNLNTDSTRTDNLNTNSTRTDNLNTNSTRTDNLTENATRTDNLTEATTNNFTNDGSVNTTGNDYKHVVGKMGGVDYVELTERMEQAIDNIDLMIINELKDLFMTIY